MQNKFLLLAICAISMLCTSAQSGRKLAKMEAEVWQRSEALNKAVFEAKDSITLKNLLHTKVTYGHSGGAVEDKNMMIKKAVNSPTVYRNIAFEKRNISIVKKTAVLRHNLRAISIENNTPSPLDLSILQVWIYEKGDWRLLARQAVKIPALK